MDKSLQYYCYLIIEKNKINRKRHNTYTKVNYYKNKVYRARSDWDLKSVNEITAKLNKTALAAIKERYAAMRIMSNPKAKKAFRDAKKASGYKARWGSNGEILSINPKHINNKLDEKLDIQQIKQLHDEYLAEAELLDYEVVNPYKEQE